MKRLVPLAFGLVVLGSAAALRPAESGPNPNAKMLIHLVPVMNRKPVGCFSNLPKAPEEAVTAGRMSPQSYYGYVLITDFDLNQGLAGVQFGISYDDSAKHGVDILSWQSCALYEWPMDGWPASETGNLLTWNQAEDCQEVAPLSVGFFYLTAYSPDRLKLIPRPVDSMACVAVCGLTASKTKELVDVLKPESLGWVDFGEGSGYNPWDPKQDLGKLKFKPFKD